MSRLIVLLAIGILGYLFWLEYKKRNPEQKQKFLMNSGFWAIFGVILLLVVTGRLHWISAVITAAFPILKSLSGLALRGLPFLQLWLRKRQEKHQQQQHTGSETPPVQNSGTMSEDEALQILGLEPGANKDEIILAHKKLMQKIHPDRGGNDYLASKLNTARDFLLKN